MDLTRVNTVATVVFRLTQFTKLQSQIGNKYTEILSGTPFTREGSSQVSQGFMWNFRSIVPVNTVNDVWALGTAVARPLHTGKVAGSIPAAPTTSRAAAACLR